MALKRNPEHVVDFPLVPIGVFVNSLNRRKFEGLVVYGDLYEDTIILGRIPNCILGRKPMGRLIRPVDHLRLVDGGEVKEDGEWSLRVRFEGLQFVDKFVRRYGSDLGDSVVTAEAALEVLVVL
jgi:hypothetical protein